MESKHHCGGNDESGSRFAPRRAGALVVLISVMAFLSLPISAEEASDDSLEAIQRRAEQLERSLQRKADLASESHNASLEKKLDSLLTEVRNIRSSGRSPSAVRVDELSKRLETLVARLENVRPVQSTGPVGPPRDERTSGEYSYVEDFSSVDEGDLPRNWTGGRCGVRTERGRRFVAALEPGPSDLSFSGFKTNGDFTIDVELDAGKDIGWVHIGKGSIMGKYEWRGAGGRIVKINDGSGVDVGDIRVGVHSYRLSRRGRVVKFAVDDGPSAICRVSGGETNGPLSIEVWASDYKVYSVRCTGQPPER